MSRRVYAAIQVARWTRCYEADSVHWDPGGFSQDDPHALFGLDDLVRRQVRELMHFSARPCDLKRFDLFALS